MVKKGVSEDLASTMTSLISSPLPSEFSAAQQRSYVTYSISAIPQRNANTKDDAHEPHLTILESRSVLAAGGVTGFRTWEPALHLGQFLCQHPAIVRGKRVLELGTGTGHVSLLCAKYLEAAHVIASDGSEEVIRNLPENLALNLSPRETVDPTWTGESGTFDRLTALVYEWGKPIAECDVPTEKSNTIDVILGADLLFDPTIIPALVQSMGDFLQAYPTAEAYLAVAKRQQATFELFMKKCRTRDLAVRDLGYPVPRRSEQCGPFYKDEPDIKIYQIISGSTADSMRG